jgi:hypothetical protein
MPWAILVCDNGDDPEKVLRLLADHGRIRSLEADGYLVDEGDDPDPRRAAHRARQRRYRARKRDAGDARDGDARDAGDALDEDEMSKFSGGIHSLSPVKPEERVSDPPNVTRVTRDAGDAVTRDARDAGGVAVCVHCRRPSPCHCPDMETPRHPSVVLTDDERAAGQARIRELRDEWQRQRGTS